MQETPTPTLPEPSGSNPDTGRDTYAAADLEGLQVAGSASLRTLVRKSYGAAAWITTAPKALCLDLLTSGRDPEIAPAGTIAPPPGNAASMLADAVRAIAGESVSEARVKAIVEETIGEAGNIEARISDAVSAALNSVKPLRIQVNDLPPFDASGQHDLFPDLVEVAAIGLRTWIAGPAGSGKTHASAEAARAAGMVAYICPPSLTRYDVVGYLDAHSQYVETQVSLWARSEVPAALILDEVDGWSEAAQLAANLPLANGHFPLTGGGAVDIYRAGTVHKWICATANTWGTGPNAKYVGRRKMDAAFLNRFDVKMLWPYDEELERRIALPHAGPEKQDAAARLVRQIQKARAHVDSKGIEITISPRQSIAACKALRVNMPAGKVWERIILGGSTELQRAEIMRGAGAV
jgi:hypothetical protein